VWQGGYVEEQRGKTRKNEEKQGKTRKNEEKRGKTRKNDQYSETPP
jgi:hypothetical protein